MGNERAPHHALLVQFLAALLQRTLGCSTQETHQQALQGFLDDLTPWISPADLPRRLGQPFTLFDHLAFTPNGVDGDEDVRVALSPAGEVVFRAWLCQRAIAIASTHRSRDWPYRPCPISASPKAARTWARSASGGLGGTKRTAVRYCSKAPAPPVAAK